MKIFKTIKLHSDIYYADVYYSLSNRMSKRQTLKGYGVLGCFLIRKYLAYIDREA